MNFKEEWSKVGYNLEELYFEKVNRELINEMKKHTEQEQGAQILQFRPRVKESEHEIKKVA